MPNRYCNLEGTKLIKDDFKNINIGFDKVQNDIDVIDAKITETQTETREQVAYIDDKANDAITIANLASQQVDDADLKVTEAVGKVEDIQNQVNNLVVEGDSSPAIAQALAGTDFATLREYREHNDTQLAQKANDSDVRKKSVKISQNDISEELLQQMAGNTPINAVPADGAVTPKKTSFFTRYKSKNLFDKTDTSNYILGKAFTNTGAMITDANWNISQPIYGNFNTGDTIVVSRSTADNNNTARAIYTTSNICAFDKNGTFLKFGSGTLILPANTDHIRFQLWNNSQNTRFLQVEINTTNTSYEDYYDYYRLAWSNIANESSVNETLVKNIGRQLVLPGYLYAVEGKSFNVFYDNIILNGNGNQLNVHNGTYDILNSYQRFAKLVKMTSGNHPYSFTLAEEYSSFDQKATDIKKTGQVRIASVSAGSGVTKKCLFIGDSLTEAGYITQKLLDLFTTDVMKIELLGSRGSGSNKHEGRGGWSAINYTTQASYNSKSNAFWNPSASAFDFAYYMSQQGYVSVDNVFICLGTNDIPYYKNQIDSIIPAWQTMINSIKAFNSNIKVFLWCLPMPCELVYNQPKKNDFLTMKKLIIDTFDNTTYRNQNIWVVDVGCTVDPLNDFPSTDEPISEYGTATFKKPTDEIHPMPSGYYNMANMIYGAIKYNV